MLRRAVTENVTHELLQNAADAKNAPQERWWNDVTFEIEEAEMDRGVHSAPRHAFFSPSTQKA